MALTQVDQGLLGTYAQYTGFKNRIINGQMAIWQRGTTVTSVGIDTYSVDRFKQWANSGAETGRSTISQSTDVPSGQGFQYSSLIQVTTAEASPPASDAYAFAQRIEANNVYDLSYGGSSAQSVTVSFWAKAVNKTGIYSVSLVAYGAASANVIVQEVTLTTSWTKYTLTFAGNTSLALTTTGANAGLQLAIGLMTGTKSATLNTWASASSLGNNFSANQVNFYDSTSNALYITGVQLEKGSTATSFDYRPYGTELMLCQRYYWVICNGDNQSIANASAFSSSEVDCIIQHPVPMRASPTLSSTSGSAYYNFRSNGGGQTFTTLSLIEANTLLTRLYSSTVSTTSGAGGYLKTNSASAFAALTAEL